MFSRIGLTEIIIIVGLIILIFGARKFPEIMGNIGDGIKKFRDTQKDEGSDDKSGNDHN